MHKDMKIENLFVRNAESIQVAELAVGDFGAAQKGKLTVSGRHRNPYAIIARIDGIFLDLTCVYRLVGDLVPVQAP